MKVVLQRVAHASVKTEQIMNCIDQGYLLLVGIGEETIDEDLAVVAKKIANARLFEDEAGKMNLSIKEVNGSILSISQFTLYADVKKGNRPGFSGAMHPDSAEQMYQSFNQLLVQEGIEVLPGEFGADMAVELLNDGPVTVIYESRQGKIQ